MQATRAAAAAHQRQRTVLAQPVGGYGKSGNQQQQRGSGHGFNN
jgi:hypothetical protein